ncbi:MAG: hypothetical protein QOK15_2144 [Nocardioidaceae bacterium]|nr:hypothetical protein [Nocardioidaceae bacterium]
MTQDTSSELPQVAVATVVRDEAVMLPRWVAHYSAQLGGADRLVVIDDNTADGSTDGLPCTVIRMPPRPKGSFEPTRMGMINGIAAGLLAAYDAVVFADADEFLVADPAKYADLRELIADRPGRDVIGATTLNVVHHLSEEPPLDPARPVLEQRHLAKFLPLMCKPAVKRIPAGWVAASHGIRAPFAVDPDLMMFHLKFADRDHLAAAAAHRHRLVEDHGRPRNTSWSAGEDAMVALLERINADLRPQKVKPFEIDAKRLARVVEQRGEKVHRTTGAGQVQAMERQPFVSVPERFRGTV